VKRQDASTGQVIDDGLSSGRDSEFHLKIYSPFKVYYDDVADSISADNDTGPFDILKNHKNFMTLINSCTLVVRIAERVEKISISRGIMHVKANEVIVFLDV
jgi:F0F1-type ATP synthase epsilon subunit